MGVPCLDGPANETILPGLDGRDADRFLELEHQTGPNRSDDVRRAALLPVLDVGDEVVPHRVDVGHGATTGHMRDSIGEQFPPRHQDTGGAGAADQLVGGDEHCVQMRHVDLYVGRGSGEVPTGDGAVAVQKGRYRLGVGHDARDVRRGRERPDELRTVGVLGQLDLEVGEIDVTVGVLVDGDDIGDGLSPRQFVRMVFVRADEDNRSLIGRDVPAEAESVVEVGRNPKSENADQPVDRSRGSRAAEDDGVFVGGPDASGDQCPRVLSEAGSLKPRARGFGVGVGITGQHPLAQVVLDERQRPTGRGVVGIDDGSRSKGPVDHFGRADDRRPNVGDQIIGRLSHGGLSFLGHPPSSRPCPPEVRRGGRAPAHPRCCA